VSLVADQLDDLVKVADLAGHVDTRTTQSYRHAVRPSLPHAIAAWESLLARAADLPLEGPGANLVLNPVSRALDTVLERCRLSQVSWRT
jgi:hypothetical protein